MAGTAEGLSHGLLRSHQYIRVSPHVTRDKYWLAYIFVSQRCVRVMGRKGPGGALSMHTQLSFFTIHPVSLNLGDIVADIVYEPEPQPLRAHLKHTLEALPHPVENNLSVGKSIVGSSCHGGQVLPPFLGGNGSATQLPVR